MARRTRGIYKRKNSPYWQFAFQRSDGKLIRGSTKTTTMDEAEVFLRRRQNEESLPKTQGDEPSLMLLSQLGTFYQSTLFKKTTEKTAAACFKRLIEGLGDVPVSTLTPMTLDIYIKKRLEAVSVCTLRQELQYLKSALHKAANRKLIPRHIYTDLREVRTPKAPPKRRRFLTPLEIVRLLLCSPQWFQRFLLFAVLTGFRREEICRLTWEMVDLTRGFLNLDTSKNGNSRNVIMLPMVHRMLQRIRAESPNSLFVFRNAHNQPVSHTYVDEVFLDACNRAGVTNAEFHDTRRTFGSWHSMGGTHLSVIQELMGHADERATKIYECLSPDHTMHQATRLDPTAPPIAKPENYFAVLHTLCTKPPFANVLNSDLFGQTGPISLTTPQSALGFSSKTPHAA